MSNQLIDDLSALGFSDKEARVYLTLLELGTASVHQIADHSDVNRSSTYPIVESLKKKGMVGLVEKSSVQEFFAVSPEILTRSAESSLYAAQGKLERIQNALPELKGMYKKFTYRPSVRVFEGVAGLEQAMMETLQTQEKVFRAFTSSENLLTLMSESIKAWVKNRIQNQIRARVIYVDNELSHTFNSPQFLTPIGFEPSKFYLEAVYLPKETYPFPVDMIIWDNSVGYLTVEGGTITTIILEGKEIGIMMKNMFDMAFEQAKLNGTYEET